MSEENENKKSGLTVGGVSGSKKMRLGRVHKKKTDDAPETPVQAPVTETAAPAQAPAPAPAEEVKPVKKAPAKKDAVEETKTEEKPAEEKKTAKKTAAKTETSEKKPAARKTAEKKEEAKADVEEKKPAKKASSKTVKAEPKEEKKAEEPVKKEPEAETKPAEEKKPEAKPEAKTAPAAEEKKPEIKPEPKPEVKPEPKPETKPRLSSAVISLPDVPARGETIRSSTVITYAGRDKKSPVRSGQGGGYNNNRGGGFQGNKSGGGFDKDKDDDNQRPQFKRAPKPRAEAPIEDAKKSRSSYAEKSAFDKKHNNSDRRDGEKNANIDKRKQSRTSQFSGRVNSDGDYDDFSFKKKKKKQETQQTAVEQVITEIKIPAFITVKEFAEGIGKKSSDIIMALMKLGVMATINQELDFDTACLVADSFGINAELLEEKTEEDILFVDEDTRFDIS